VNVAKHVRHTGTVESHRFVPTRSVGAEIESLTAGYPEGVVEPGITILKFDDTSHRDHQQMRLKRLVVLHYAIVWLIRI
jgi:hypothetical protein